MNENGAIAFRYVLANDTSGIAVARVVPEPESPVLLVTGVAAGRVRRRRPFGTHSPRLMWLTAVCLVLTCFASPAAAANYNFINIADMTQFPLGFNEISLNNQGQVAFLAPAADERFGVFTGDGGPITTIVDESGEFASFRSPSINDSGVVAFYADYDGPGEGIFTSDGGPVTRIADSLVELPQVILRFPVINSNGTVAFRGLYGEFHPSRLNFSIHTGNGGPLTLIADSSGPLLTIGSVPLRMNDHGTVAFSALLDGSPGIGIFAGNGGPLTTVVTQAAGFNGFGQPSINNHGTLAFRSQRAGVDGIFTINGGPFVTIADTNGPFAAFSREALINDEGQVAFRASLDAGGQGIFTGPDPIADKVIQTGDPLFGSTVIVVPGLVTSDATFDLNDRGAVAFVYHLANGTQGIAIARLVPEVTSLQLMLIVAVAMLNRRRVWRLSTILGQSNLGGLR